MVMITIMNRDIPLNIIKTKNKNTYYRFKKDGHIQINLSKYQSQEEAINYIYENSKKFIRKYNQVLNVQPLDPTKYLYLGKQYNIVLEKDIEEVFIEDENIFLPSAHTDHYTKIFERQEMMRQLFSLKEKHKDNDVVDITNITLKTRHMTSRHGSCIASKRKININTSLIHYDPKYIEYVFLHEISHLKHANHSDKFYSTFEKLCPNYKQLRKELREQYR